ncbi:hypothetical protein Pcinc_016186 [Petrolisthes cinctipes]|uniref:Methyltransferase domain-containing protein n=1 Tax=Petrolisthes cinctipes TaxID=88211 RepID=A0AAE1FRK1_PETCI|nr:hypothetical protein Pcinc_016186 [Petrolisthes cinctipes]
MMTSQNTLYRKVGWAALIGVVCLTVYVMNTRKDGAYVYMTLPQLSSGGQVRELLDVKHCPVPGLASIEQYRTYLHHTETACKDMRQFGGHPPAPRDGRKFICMDQRFNIKPGNCTIYSFGINNEWSFEDEMEKFGCKVYAFDPTMGKEDHRRSPGIQFFATGIANYQGVKKIGMGKNWAMRKVDRFENLVNQVGETDNEIDFIKLDVELSEVDFLQDMLLNSQHVLHNVKQIAMEVHDDTFKGDLSQTSRQQVFWPYFMLMRCHDFRLIQSRDAGRWREVVWAREVKW